MRPLSVRIFLSVLLLSAAVPEVVQAQMRSEYRAFWVDTFNTLLTTQANVQAVVNNAKLANANAIFAQVRRRGDAWYIQSLEPPPDLSPRIAAGFDPLQSLVDAAHAEGIEVHAFVILGAIWNRDPIAAGGLPTSGGHIFNLHGGYDPVTKKIVAGPENWLTRTLLADTAVPALPSLPAISYQGHRFGAEFWMDFGHPDASAYTIDVLMKLVRNYRIDGLHLDRIRYPEISIGGQTANAGANIGYNPTNVRRFQARYGLNPATPPVQGDDQWEQWRRDQVTNFVRRLYLSAIDEKPSLRISAALIAFGGGPVTESQWTSAEAFWRVHQDWRAWTQEGIIDIAIPMAYKREHTSDAAQFNQWNEWMKNHQYDRAGMLGLAGNSPANSVEGMLRQTRRALAPLTTTGKNGVGVIYFSMANTNAAFNTVANPTNPLALPAPRPTPLRNFTEFTAGLKTGKFGTTQFEDPILNPVGIFNEPASIPSFPWKSAPTKGHLKGFAIRSDGTVLDTATVTIENLATAATRTTQTDGGGFYGGVDLIPGRYFVTAVLGGNTLYGCVTNVVAGSVSTTNLAADTSGPALTVPAPITRDAEAGSCSAAVNWTLSGSDCLPFTIATSHASGSRFPVGTTTVTATATDRAGNIATKQFAVTVRDAEKPVITGLRTSKDRIWPPNRQMESVRILYNTGDNCSGAITTTITVTSNEPTDGTAWVVINNHEVELRAERSGAGDGRIYTITVTATDVAGNTTSASTTVTVPHDMGNGNN